MPQCYYDFHIYAENYGLSQIASKLIKDMRTLNLNVYPPNNLNIVREFGKKMGRGEYRPQTNTIVLFDNKWCRKTLVHELFHAMSSFTRISDLYEIAFRERFFIEGLTEFFTGYLLYWKYKNCYNQWIKCEYSVCTISYTKYIRLFGAAAQILIPIMKLAEIYIYNPKDNWYNKYDEFLRKYDLKDFLIIKPRGKRKIPSFTLFKDMMERVILKRFNKKRVKEFKDLLYKAPLYIVLDYSNMKKL